MRNVLFTGAGLVVLGLVGFLSLRQGFGAPTARPAPPAIALVGDKAGLHRLDAKSGVTRRLIDGELTLADAVAWFRYIDADSPSAGKVVPQIDVGLSEEERRCREVMRWAQMQAEADGPPEKVAALDHRLEAELADHLKSAAPPVP